jgi:hypothetical protein
MDYPNVLTWRAEQKPQNLTRTGFARTTKMQFHHMDWQAHWTSSLRTSSRFLHHKGYSTTCLQTSQKDEQMKMREQAVYESPLEHLKRAQKWKLEQRAPALASETVSHTD